MEQDQSGSCFTSRSAKSIRIVLQIGARCHAAPARKSDPSAAGLESNPCRNPSHPPAECRSRPMDHLGAFLCAWPTRIMWRDARPQQHPLPC
jgi:hypothetical protein